MPHAPDETIELMPDKERHVLIGVVAPDMLGPGEEPLDELADLVEAAGAEVVGRLPQRRARPHPRTYLGKGKLEELVAEVARLRPDTVVADTDLSPAQLQTLEAAVRTKVIDRSEVILDIFASRARTHQARLEVMLAQAQYELPRLGRKWTHLERLGGGIGTRGPGESQIETDRRLLRGRIQRLRRELAGIEARKEQEVAARAREYTVSLVGYTNAGKTTLLNALTGAEARVADMLFATLDTLTRPVDLGGGVQALASDTVGFIRRLPHHLVASFHATLEEAVQAKLLLHVVDASSPVAAEEVRAVDQTLASLELRGRDEVYVLNKIDRVGDPALVDALRERYAPAVAVSARTGQGIDRLRELLRERACRTLGRRTVVVRFPGGDGRRLAALSAHGEVFDLRYEGSEAVARVELSEADLERLRRLPGPMQVQEAQAAQDRDRG